MSHGLSACPSPEAQQQFSAVAFLLHLVAAVGAVQPRGGEQQERQALHE